MPLRVVAAPRERSDTVDGLFTNAEEVDGRVRSERKFADGHAGRGADVGLVAILDLSAACYCRVTHKLAGWMATKIQTATVRKRTLLCLSLNTNPKIQV